MKKKQVIKLNENQLRRIVKESVKRVLNEADVVGGTNTYNDKSTWADDYDEYSSSENGTSENIMVPDFIQTWADRLENILNKKFFEKFTNLKSDDELGNQFRVIAHVDNVYNYEHSMFSGHSKTVRKIVFEVMCDNTYRMVRECNMDYPRACNICVQMISKYATLLFGSMPGVSVTVNGNYDTTHDGSMDVILYIEEHQSFERNRYHDLETTTKNPSNSRLFRNNPSRQIPQRNSTFRSDDED